MKNNNKLMIAIAAFAAVATTSCTPDAETPAGLFNHGWHFMRTDSAFTAADSAAIVGGKVPSTMQAVSLPHTPRLEPMLVNDQWQGICYYSKSFDLSAQQLRKNLFLKFEAAQNVADVFVNGRHVAHHMGGYLPFTVGLNEAAVAGKNTVVVRLDNTDNKTTGPKPLHLLDFNTFGGIYRDVKFIVKDDVYITDPNHVHADGGIMVSPDIAADYASAAVNVRTNVANSSDAKQSAIVRHRLIDTDGQAVAEANGEIVIGSASTACANIRLNVEEPRLWSPASPALYTLVTEVVVDGKTVDTDRTRIGLRTLEVTADGLKINGQKTFLRGVNRHQEYPHVGYAMSNEAQVRDAAKIKRAGFDYVRASHYPPSPAFLDACDSLGIMVLDAILGWQYFGDSAFEAHAIESSRQLIRRDRNHPCVLAWELSINETQMPASFVEGVQRVRDEEMPGSYTAGWMKGRYDIYIEARQHRHGVDTTRPLIVSEYGDWEYYAQNAGFNQDTWSDLKPAERTSRQPRESGERHMLQQALNLQEAHNDNRSTHALADGYWVMFDYNRGYANDIEYSGLMDIYRLPKFATYLFASQRDAQGDGAFARPVVFVASHLTDSSAAAVRVFTNCDEVRLFANGNALPSGKPMEEISQHLAHKPLVFDMGDVRADSLVAVGYIGGKEACRHVVRRPGEPAGLLLSADTSDVRATVEASDPVFVYASVADANGTVVPLNGRKVTFEIVGGDARFATATEMSASFTADVLGGIASAVLVIGNEPGTVQIKASADGMEQTINITTYPRR